MNSIELKRYTFVLPKKPRLVRVKGSGPTENKTPHSPPWDTATYREMPQKFFLRFGLRRICWPGIFKGSTHAVFCHTLPCHHRSTHQRTEAIVIASWRDWYARKREGHLLPQPTPLGDAVWKVTQLGGQVHERASDYGVYPTTRATGAKR